MRTMRFAWCLVWGCVALAVQMAGATVSVDLAGVWSVRLADGEQPAVPLNVPGDVHSALLAAGRIPDPYFGANEMDIQWVGQKAWLAERSFEVPTTLLECQSVILRLEHVDTFCELAINGRKVGETGNRFRRYDFEVKPLLRPGRNMITALFRSAEQITEERGDALSYPIPMVDNGRVPHINLIRKPACHGGWDWGIAVMATGFAGPVKLLGSDLARIDYVYCDQVHRPDVCEVTVTAEVTSADGGESTLAVAFGEARGAAGDAEAWRESRLGDGGRAAEAVVAEWRGDQHLYDLKVTVGADTLTRRLGLRTIEVDQSARPR